MREEDRLAAQHGAHDYRVQNERNRWIIEEQRRQQQQDYSDQLARQRQQQQDERAAKQRRENARTASRAQTAKKSARSRSESEWVKWSTGWGVFGAIAGGLAASTLHDAELPTEAILAAAVGGGIAIGMLWKVILSCLIIAGIGFVMIQFFGAS